MGNAALDQQLSDAAKAGDLIRAQALLEQGANIEGPQGGEPPLFRAAYNGHAALTRYLIERGANLNSRNGTNSTPLMGAAEQGKAETVRLLIQAGADLRLVNSANMTARGYAAQHHNTAIVDMIDNPEPLIRKPDVNEVTLSWPVNDRTLQEVFNFEKKERVTLIRKGENGPVEAVTRDSFSEIADDTTLRAAFEKYRQQGGKRDEGEIFGATLGKAKIRPKGM